VLEVEVFPWDSSWAACVVAGAYGTGVVVQA
jgi:hypothetical protein